MSRYTRANVRITFAVMAAALCTSPALAQQVPYTITYSYDSQGHLSQATHDGGRNDDVAVTIVTDAADNRTAKTVVGRTHTPSVIVPLRGFKVIPLP